MRVSWLEADLDNVDREFTRTAEAVTHAKTNLNMALKGLEARLESNTDKLQARVEKMEDEHKAELAAVKKETAEEISGNRKILTGLLLTMLGTAIAMIATVMTVRGGF